MTTLRGRTNADLWFEKWAEVDASAANQLAAQREAIATGVEVLGCKCARLISAKAPAEHVPACPLAIAAGVREGRIG